MQILISVATPWQPPPFHFFLEIQANGGGSRKKHFATEICILTLFSHIYQSQGANSKVRSLQLNDPRMALS